MNNRDNKVLAERYIKDIYSNLDEFSLSKLHATLEYIAKNAVASGVSHYDDPAVAEQKNRRKKLAAEAYKKLLPNILNAINYLYELEYKRSLIQKDYAYFAAGKFPEIESCMRKIAAYLRLFAISNVAIVHHLWAWEDEKVDNSKPVLLQIINQEYPKYTHYVSRLKENQMEKGAYFWKTDFEPIFQRMFSDDVTQQVAGLSLFFNVYHDDGRGLIVARGEFEAEPGQPTHEEYPDFIIPLHMYEKASKINHRKVERDLKQEISGF